MLYIHHTQKGSAVMVVGFIPNGLSCCLWPILGRGHIPISLTAVTYKAITAAIHALR